MEYLKENDTPIGLGGRKVDRSHKPRKRETASARRFKALTAKQPTKSQPKKARLHVAIVNNHTLWSLDYNVAEHLFNQKLEIIKNRIFLKYGYGNKFIYTDRAWQTNKEVAYCIQQDIDWYNEQDIEVKLNI